jgi:hypothetical protein
MAITTTTTGTGLHRDGSYMTPGLSANTWSTGFWYKAPSLPTGTDKYCLWHFGDVSHVNPYMALYHGPSGFYIVVYNGVTTLTSSVSGQQTYVPDTWVYMSLMTLGGAFRFYFNSRQLFSVTRNFSTFSFVETDEYLGTDTTGSLGGASFAYQRVSNNWGSGQLNTTGGMIEKFQTVAWARTGLYSETTLDDTSTGLNDTSGNGYHWSTVGTVNTLTAGPLSLVAGIFSDNFNSANALTDVWTDVPNSASKSAVGCAGSRAYGCTTSQIWKGFDTRYTDGSVRFLVWYYNPSTPAASTQIATVDSAHTGEEFASPQGFQWVLFILGDGTLRLRLVTGGGPVTTFYDSSAGLIPTDGSPSAIQVCWSITTTQDVVVYVNNVAVITATGVTLAGIDASYQNWKRVSLNTTSTASIQTYFDNFEIENVNSVETWSNCTANRIVNCAIIPVITIGNIVVNKVTENAPENDDTAFPFASPGLDPTEFTLHNGETQEFLDIDAGTYSIVEDVPENWSVSYDVSNGSPNTAITVAADETVTVNVTNTYTGPRIRPNQWKLYGFNMKLRREERG